MNKKTLAWLLVVLLLAVGCSAKTDTPAVPVAEEETSAVVEAVEGTQEPEAVEPEEEAFESFTVTDMTGREITFTEPVERVVALSAADCEIIFALGAEDKLVGRGEYCDYPGEVLDVSSVQSGYETNIEQIIDLEPDVLFMATMAQTTEQVDQLEAAGIHVVVSDAQTIEGTYTAIRLLGKVMDKSDVAEDLIADMQAAFDQIAAQPIEGEKSVYFEVSPLQWGLWTAGNHTFMNEVAQMMGLKNCFEDVENWAEISEEQVLVRNPDYIVTISMYYGEGPMPVEEIASRPGWENITAVKDGNILNLPDNELTRPGPRLAEGAQMLYDFVSESIAAMAPAA